MEGCRHGDRIIGSASYAVLRCRCRWPRLSDQCLTMRVDASRTQCGVTGKLPGRPGGSLVMPCDFIDGDDMAVSDFDPGIESCLELIAALLHAQGRIERLHGRHATRQCTARAVAPGGRSQFDGLLM